MEINEGDVGALEFLLKNLKDHLLRVMVHA